jgi:hypothetical protein
MIKQLLQIFPSEAICWLGFISFLVTHALERKKVISHDVTDKVMLYIVLAIFFFMW